jgi:hypothetical protein
MLHPSLLKRLAQPLLVPVPKLLLLPSSRQVTPVTNTSISSKQLRRPAVRVADVAGLGQELADLQVWKVSEVLLQVAAVLVPELPISISYETALSFNNFANSFRHSLACFNRFYNRLASGTLSWRR